MRKMHICEETVGPNYIFKIWRKKICPNIISKSLCLVRLKIIAFLLYPVQHFTDSDRYMYLGDTVKNRAEKQISNSLLWFITLYIVSNLKPIYLLNHVKAKDIHIFSRSYANSPDTVWNCTTWTTMRTVIYMRGPLRTLLTPRRISLISAQMPHS